MYILSGVGVISLVVDMDKPLIRLPLPTATETIQKVSRVRLMSGLLHRQKRPLRPPLYKYAVNLAFSREMLNEGTLTKCQTPVGFGIINLSSQLHTWSFVGGGARPVIGSGLPTMMSFS